MRQLKLFMQVGTLLALSWLSLPLLDTGSTATLGYLLGSLFAHATLAATWAAFGPGPLVWRVPLSLAWMLTLPVVIAVNISFHGGPDGVPFILGCCYLGQWLLLQIPFAGLAIGYGLQLRHAGKARQDSDGQPVRFAIRHLLIVMAIVGAVLSIGRAIAPNITMFDSETPIFLFLAGASVVVTLPLQLAALMRRMAVLGVLLSLLLVAVTTAFELPLLEALGTSGPGTEDFIAINLASAVLILLVAGVVRMNGYCLEAQVAAEKPTTAFPIAKLLPICLGLLVVSKSPMACGAVPSAPPNVLFIAIDDLNDWVGCLNGHPQAHTPNIDRLAKRGILFANCHCASPACNPSRAAVFSGMMPWQTGVWSNKSKKLFQQHPEMLVLPRAFNKAGYATFGTGKLMHSGGAANRVMFGQHFRTEQRWSPFTKDAVAYTDEELASKRIGRPRHVVKMGDAQSVVLPLNRMPSDRNPQGAAGESFDWGPLDVPDAAIGDARIATWAMQRLNGQHDKPFFLGVGFYRPHIPLWAPRKYFDRLAEQQIVLPPFLQSDLKDISETGRRRALEAVTAGRHATVVKYDQWDDAVKAYLACTTFVDAQVGRLLDALDNGPYGDNTIIVLWSDHGWHLGEKQHWGKWTGWERSTRVPLIIVPPQRASDAFGKAGQASHAPVSLIDLYPTLTDLCGLPTPPALDGQSLVPLLRDPGLKSDRVVVTSFDPGNVALRSDRWRYIRYNDGSEELYNLRTDPNEWTNLAGNLKYAELLRTFRQRIPDEATP